MKHVKWDDIPYEELNEKFRRKLAWDGKIMIGLTEVAQGYVVPLHSHDNEQTTFVTSGMWRFTLEGKTVDVGPNELIFIPANVMHTAEAVESLVAYDIFTPPRQDWISGEDAYLRAIQFTEKLTTHIRAAVDQTDASRNARSTMLIRV